MQCPVKVKVEWRSHVPVFRNHDKPEILITYKSELLGDLWDLSKQETSNWFFFSFKFTQVFIWNNLFTFCITKLINKRTISLFSSVLGIWVKLLHFCVKRMFAVCDKNIPAVSLTFLRKYAAKAPIVFKMLKNIVFLGMTIYTGSRTYSTKKKSRMPPSFWQVSLLLI